MRAKTLKLQPFPVEVKLKFTEDTLPGNAVGLTEAEGSTIKVTILSKLADQFLSTAVHEAVHVVQFIQQYIECELDMETEAYMVSKVACWIVNQRKK